MARNNNSVEYDLVDEPTMQYMERFDEPNEIVRVEEDNLHVEVCIRSTGEVVRHTISRYANWRTPPQVGNGIIGGWFTNEKGRRDYDGKQVKFK